MHADISDFFKSVKDLNYLVIRNQAELLDNIVTDEHKDIDIICDDKKAFIHKAGLVQNPIFFDAVHYLAKVGDSKVPVDLREVGDGYFCDEWAHSMLDHRNTYNDLCYVMDDADQLYSLLYHCVVQKGRISDEYLGQIKDIAGRLGIDIADRNQATKALISFMSEKGYYVQAQRDSMLHIHTEELPKELDRRTGIDKTFTKIRFRLVWLRAHVKRLFCGRNRT